MCFVAAVDCVTASNDNFLLPVTVRVPEKLQLIYAAAIIATECCRFAAYTHEHADIEGFTDCTQSSNSYYVSLRSLISNPPLAIPESVKEAFEMIRARM